jgi:hypothetical protein
LASQQQRLGSDRLAPARTSAMAYGGSPMSSGRYDDDDDFEPLDTTATESVGGGVGGASGASWATSASGGEIGTMSDDALEKLLNW